MPRCRLAVRGSLPDLPPLLAEIHYGLPRQGPGDDASTARAFGMLGLKKDSLRVLDIGCGPGAQTLALARLTNGTVTALDDSPALLDELGSRIDGTLTQGRIKPVLGSMFDLPFEHRAFDLIWSEGAIYIIGFEAGLKSWRPLQKDGGAIGVTHISWLKRDIPEEPRRFWNAAYPAITSMENNRDPCRKRLCASRAFRVAASGMVDGLLYAIASAAGRTASGLCRRCGGSCGDRREPA
jgi:SAM-dependent methyltransferase